VFLKLFKKNILKNTLFVDNQQHTYVFKALKTNYNILHVTDNQLVLTLSRHS